MRQFGLSCLVVTFTKHGDGKPTTFCGKHEPSEGDVMKSEGGGWEPDGSGGEGMREAVTHSQAGDALHSLALHTQCKQKRCTRQSTLKLTASHAHACSLTHSQTKKIQSE